MKTNKLTTGFNSLTDANFQTKAESITASMMGNVNFPSTTPDMPVVSTAAPPAGEAVSIRASSAQALIDIVYSPFFIDAAMTTVATVITSLTELDPDPKSGFV